MGERREMVVHVERLYVEPDLAYKQECAPLDLLLLLNHLLHLYHSYAQNVCTIELAVLL